MIEFMRSSDGGRPKKNKCYPKIETLSIAQLYYPPTANTAAVSANSLLFT